MKKKFLAFLLVAVVSIALVCVMSTGATAASGTSGDCTWTYDEATGVLTVSGNGALGTGAVSAARNSAKKIVFEEGVTNIPNAFAYQNPNLTEVVIPSTVTSIGNNAFNQCRKLETVVIDDSNVTSIGNQAFYYCDRLTTIAFDDDLTTIGYRAFRYCSKLTSADLGNGITSLDIQLFANCISLESAVVGGTYTTLPESTFFECVKLTSATIAPTIETLGQGSFRGTTALKEFTLPSTLVVVGRSAFRATGIENVVIPEGVTSVEDYAFFEAASTTITLPSTLNNIGSYAFYGSAITSIDIPEGVTELQIKTFTNCANLKSVELPETLVTIGPSVFEKAGIEQITLPAAVKNVEHSIFRECKNLTNVTIDANLENISQKMFYQCSALKSVNIPSSVLVIGQYAFTDCVALESIEFSDGLKQILNTAFQNCKALNIDLYIPGTVKNINTYAFRNSGLKSVTFGEGVETIGEESFRGCKFETAPVFSSTVTTIGVKAFVECNLTEVTLPASITSVGATAFYQGAGCVVTVYTTEDAAYVIEWANADKWVTLGEFVVPEPEVGTEENPAYIEWEYNEDYTVATATITVEAGQKYYFMDMYGNMNLTINGEFVATTGTRFMPSVLCITNDTDAVATYELMLTYPVGSFENPAEFILDEYITVEYAEGAQEYVFTYTVLEDGIITIMMSSDEGWMYHVDNLTTGVYGDYHWYNDEDAAFSVELEVAEGDVLRISMVTYDAENEYGPAPAGELVIYGFWSALPGTAENPVYPEWEWAEDNSSGWATVTVPANKTYYFASYFNGVTLTINGETYGVLAGSRWMPATFTITNDTDADATYELVVTYPAGTFENPADLELGSTTVDIAAGSNGYVFTWIAEEDGNFVLTMPSDASWTYTINNMTSYVYGETQWSDSDPLVNPAIIEVKSGDELQIIINTYDPASWEAPEGTLTFNADFVLPSVDPTAALNVVVDGTTATATLNLSNLPEVASIAISISYADTLTVTSATTALDGFTTDPALANPVKLVWVSGENEDINGDVLVIVFTLAEGAEVVAENFTITYDVEDVFALGAEGEYIDVALVTNVVIG